MSSVEEEPVREGRSEWLSLSPAGLFRQATLELLPDRIIVKTEDAILELTGGAFERFMEKLTPWRLPQGKVDLPKVVIFTRPFRRAVSVQSSLSTPVSEGWYINMSIEIPLD